MGGRGGAREMGYGCWVGREKVRVRSETLTKVGRYRLLMGLGHINRGGSYSGSSKKNTCIFGGGSFIKLASANRF